MRFDHRGFGTCSKRAGQVDSLFPSDHKLAPLFPLPSFLLLPEVMSNVDHLVSPHRI